MKNKPRYTLWIKNLYGNWTIYKKYVHLKNAEMALNEWFKCSKNIEAKIVDEENPVMKTCECDYFHNGECALRGEKVCKGTEEYTTCYMFMKDFYEMEQIRDGNCEKL